MENPEKLIEQLFEKGILLNKEILESGNSLNSMLLSKLSGEADMLVLNKDYEDILNQQSSLVDWYEIDKYRVDAEKERDEELYQTQLQQFKHTSLHFTSAPIIQKQDISSLEVELTPPVSELSEKNKKTPSFSNAPSSFTSLSSPIQILVNYEVHPHKYEVKDFTSIFISRYRFLENLLRQRQELDNTLTINRILGKKEKERLSLIGIVQEINLTANGNLLVTLEDLTGKITVLFSKNKPELFAEGKDLVHDEIIGITGVCGDKILFAESIVFPDLPLTEPKKSEVEEAAIFISDLHVGSKLFLKEEFGRFLQWLKGEVGKEEQKEMARKVKYIFIAGDLVDGIGVYPSQEEELEIKEIHQQYAQFCKLIKEIPTDKQIIVCPGNHDLVHLAEPQPHFYKEYAPELYNLPNVIITTNPSQINIGKTATFSGFDVLLYHGYSFDYYVNAVESIRAGGGYHRADLIMKFLLKRRHLAPTFKSTPYHPSYTDDPLLIRKIPDFFATGHIHYSKVGMYKGVTMICGSCWQGKTSFQEKLGHEPEPGRVPWVNLKTREMKILKFT